MPRSKQTDTDFQGRLLDLIIDKLDKQDEKLEDIHVQTRKTNGRVTKLEATVYSAPSKKDLPPVFRDPKFIQVLLYLSLAILLGVAAITGFDIIGVLK